MSLAMEEDSTRSAEGEVDRLRLEVAQLRDALLSRPVIEQAKGIVMSVHRCDAERAWVQLTGCSQQHNVKVRGLALAVVEAVSGEAPTDQRASTVALRHLLGWPAFNRPVLDGQLHPAMRLHSVPRA